MGLTGPGARTKRRTGERERERPLGGSDGLGVSERRPVHLSAWSTACCRSARRSSLQRTEQTHSNRGCARHRTTISSVVTTLPESTGTDGVTQSRSTHASARPQQRPKHLRRQSEAHRNQVRPQFGREHPTNSRWKHNGQIRSNSTFTANKPKQEEEPSQWRSPRFRLAHRTSTRAAQGPNFTRLTGRTSRPSTRRNSHDLRTNLRSHTPCDLNVQR